MEILKKFTDENGTKWLIEKSPSIFTSRQKMLDIKVWKSCKSHGAVMLDDGVKYNTCLRLDAKTGEVIRHSDSLPDYIRDIAIGFIDPDCDRSSCGDYSPGKCDNPDCAARK